MSSSIETLAHKAKSATARLFICTEPSSSLSSKSLCCWNPLDWTVVQKVLQQIFNLIAHLAFTQVT